MITFLDTYQHRKQEIDNFLDFMKILEKRESYFDENSGNLFANFFTIPEENLRVTYSFIINIIKSDCFLMIYNIIEFSVFSIVNFIHDKIQKEELTARNINRQILYLWANSVLKDANDPNANFNTVKEKCVDIMNAILNDEPIKITTKKVFPAGNLDSISIKSVFKNHNIEIPTGNYRPDILDDIKKYRNNLAHGSVSFSEAVRDNTIDDIKDKWEKIKIFLDDLVVTVQEYINNKNYKAETC